MDVTPGDEALLAKELHVRARLVIGEGERGVVELAEPHKVELRKKGGTKVVGGREHVGGERTWGGERKWGVRWRGQGMWGSTGRREIAGDGGRWRRRWQEVAGDGARGFAPPCS